MKRYQQPVTKYLMLDAEALCDIGIHDSKGGTQLGKDIDDLPEEDNAQAFGTNWDE